MLNFEYQNKTHIIFGKETEKQVGEQTKKYGRKVLLHYGGGTIKKIGLYDTVIKSLTDANIAWVELGGVEPNPKLKLVHEGIDLCRKEKVDFILAIGGGSVIDSAKAISMGVQYDGDVWDFYDRKAVLKEALPVGVVLTIPAAGSETSGGSVITKEEGQYKRPYGSGLLRPVFAIMNPEITYSLPAYQTAAGAVDMMAHVMERYFTREMDVDVTDRLSEAILQSIIENAPKAIKNPNDYAARAEMMWAGTLAHNGLVGTGRIEDWASHDIEHELSGIYEITHGAGLAIIFPAWMKYVYKTDLKRFAQFAHRVWNVGETYHDLEDMAMEGISRMEGFFKSIGMPIRLSKAGITDNQYEVMANKCAENREYVGNFVKLQKEDIINIYELAK